MSVAGLSGSKTPDAAKTAATSQPGDAGGSGEPGGGSNAAPSRPEWAPAEHWNEEAGSLNLETFGSHYGELAAFRKEHDDKIAAIPAKPEDVKFALPEGVTLPEGATIDESNPLFAKARDLVVSKKIDPAVANEFYGLYVQSQVEEVTALQEKIGAEKQKLGPQADTRIDAVYRALNAAIGPKLTNAMIGPPDASRLYTADAVFALEAIAKKLVNQGGSSPPAQTHAPEKKETPWVEKMFPARFAGATAK